MCIQNLFEVLKEDLTVEYLFPGLFCIHNSYGFTGWSIPQHEGPLLASGCCPPLPVSYGLCCDSDGNPQRRLQRFSRCVLYGGVVLLLRHDSCGIFPGCYSSLQLPAHILGEPHGHMCCLCDAHVSHMIRSLVGLVMQVQYKCTATGCT